MIDAVIGREHGTNRLLITIGNKAVALTPNNSVPKTVSSTHCRLQIDDNGVMTITNIKSQLFTYVNGIQINSKHITYESSIELGEDRFQLDMNAVKKAIETIVPPPPLVCSLASLEQVWKEYDEKRLKLQLKEQRRNNWRTGGGILSMLGILFMFIPLPDSLGDNIQLTLRIVFTSAALLVAVFFFIRGFDTSKSLVVKMRDLDADFRKKYVCPNPKCHHFMGMQPYDVLKANKKCPYCGCHYSTEKS